MEDETEDESLVAPWRKHPLWQMPATGSKQAGNYSSCRAGEIIEAAGNLALFGNPDGERRAVNFEDEYLGDQWPWRYAVPAPGIVAEMLQAVKLTQAELVKQYPEMIGGFRSVGLAEKLRKTLKVATDRDRLRYPVLTSRYELPVNLWDYIKSLSREDTEALVSGHFREGRHLPAR